MIFSSRTRSSSILLLELSLFSSNALDFFFFKGFSFLDFFILDELSRRDIVLSVSIFIINSSLLIESDLIFIWLLWGEVEEFCLRDFLLLFCFFSILESSFFWSLLLRTSWFSIKEFWMFFSGEESLFNWKDLHFLVFRWLLRLCFNTIVLQKLHSNLGLLSVLDDNSSISPSFWWEKLSIELDILFNIVYKY